MRYRPRVPRTSRVQPGGMVFHVLNRGNARMTLFDKSSDYDAFEKAMLAAGHHVRMGAAMGSEL